MPVQYMSHLCICLSQISVLLKQLNVGSHKQCHMIAQGLVVWCWRSRQNSNRIPPNGGAKWRWGTLKLATFNKSLAITQKCWPSHVNLVRSQVYHTECPPLSAARLPWRSASHGFVSELTRWLGLCRCEYIDIGLAPLMKVLPRQTSLS